MASSIDFAKLSGPVDPSEPCGLDLDLEGDPQFMNFMARVESLLPDAYVKWNDKEGRFLAFDRSTIPFEAEFATIQALLQQTRDLRLLAISARLFALDRNLDGCARSVNLIADLIDEHWDHVHPQGEGGDFAYRIAVLQSLDDTPTMVMPLQSLPLITHKRFGAITYRSVMIADGLAQPRDDEPSVDKKDIERALGDADPEALSMTRGSATMLHAAARRIEAGSNARLENDGSLRLTPLIELAENMLKVLDGGAARAINLAGSEASLIPVAEPDQVVPALEPTGSITSVDAAAAALAAVSEYFGVYERSSPAALLVRQAERLIGLPFQEVIRSLLPTYAEDATIYIGPKPGKSFQLRVDRMTEIVGSEEGRERPKKKPGLIASLIEPTPPHFTVATRPAAVALLREVGAFYRAQEPSSPIPLFTDRACAMVNQDFLSILSDVLPGIRLSRESD